MQSGGTGVEECRTIARNRESRRFWPILASFGTAYFMCRLTWGPHNFGCVEIQPQRPYTFLIAFDLKFLLVTSFFCIFELFVRGCVCKLPGLVLATGTAGPWEALVSPARSRGPKSGQARSCQESSSPFESPFPHVSGGTYFYLIILHGFRDLGAPSAPI